MKRRITAIILILTFLISAIGMFAVSGEETTDEVDILRGIFGGIDDISPDEKAVDLPYVDGTMLSDVREPIYMSNNISKIFGESSFSSDDASWNDTVKYSLKEGVVKINGTSYSIDGEFKILNAASGDFNNNGKKSELALLVAAKLTSGKSVLLLCTASASERDGILCPIVVLYSGTVEFYNNTKKFVNCMEIVCADVNGDGYDEIITATPTSGYTTSGSDKYKLDKHSGSYLWSLNKAKLNNTSWKSSDGWQQKPSSFNTGMNMSYGDNCILGAPGTTASLAAGDVDGDGYDDVVTAFSTTKAQYNANYSSNTFSVYYIGGAPTVDEMILKRMPIMNFIDGEVKKKLYLGAWSGNAAGFDVDICDVDDSGKPTIFMSFKETDHSWAAMSGTKMYTPSFYIYSFDMKDDYNDFTSSLVYHGGIYHHGWMAGDVNDTDYVYRTDPIDCAPVRIGVLKNDYGLSDDAKGYSAHGTIITDQRLLSFVRYPDGDVYRYDIQNNGLYTKIGDINDKDNGHGFKNNDCVFYRNGTNIFNIKTANVRFDGTQYEDAALVSAYTDDGFKMYYISSEQNGYSASEISNKNAYIAAAMPDTDNDSIYLKYKNHAFFWADPVIIAALASPPYFKSLPSDMYTNSQTTYGKSLTSASGKTQSYTVSAGSYVSTEVKAGALGVAGVFEAESEVMKNSTLDKEETTEVTYTQSFSASGGSDTVVLSTVAYDAYSYTAYYAGVDGKLSQSPYIVYVPRGGSGSIKIASLNYDDYLEFSKYSENVLPDLKDVFTHKVGQPESYPTVTPSGSNVLAGSILTHNNIAGFPTDLSSQTLSIDITNETSEVTSSGSSVSVKLGGGVESGADEIFGMAEVGSKITVGSSTEKEYESGKIKTSAVGTSIEGTVFGQGDGLNEKQEKAYFNWRLLHYIHNFKDGNSVQQFPVVTYIVSGVNQPVGVVPKSLSVLPSEVSIEQVGPKTTGYVNDADFIADITGVTREAYTALENAPFGMTLDTSGSNIGSSGEYPFKVKINSNVKPGRYEVYLNVGGVLSNPFVVNVEKYTAPVWLEADKDEVDFGSARYNYSKGTPAADAQTVTIKNIYTEQIKNLNASLDENSEFEIVEQLSANLLYAKDLPNSTATVKIAPKSGLDTGVHTGILKVSNGVTSTFVSLKYTVSEPTVPDAPYFSNTFTQPSNPISLNINAPKDDGGGEMQYYLYTIKGHKDYVDGDNQIWKKVNQTAQSGNSFNLNIPETLLVGEKYTLGVKAKTTVGESKAGWFEFEVSESPGDPDPVKNIKVYPGDGCITVTWDEPDYWGENKYHPEVYSKMYSLYIKKDDSKTGYGYTVNYGEECEYTFTGLENGATYEISVGTATFERHTAGDIMYITPTSAVITPSRPRKLAANMSYKRAELNWDTPGYTGDGITAYQVSKDGGTSWIDVSGDTLNYTFDNLTTNEEYYFCVRAKNTVGYGDNATLAATAPSKLEAPEVIRVFKGYECLEMEWYPVDDQSVNGYEAKVDDGEWKKIEPVLFEGTLRYVFTGLENDVMHSLNLRATDNEGGGKETGNDNAMPRSIAPRPPVNPRVEARNGGIAFFADKANESDKLEYKVEGGLSWNLNGYRRENGYDNGKEYAVVIYTSGKDENRTPLRSAVYFTVTPDETVPDEPDAPNIKAYVGDEYVRFEWKVENDGGKPIEWYEVSYGDNNSVILPETETSFEVRLREFDEYPFFEVTAYNSIGSSSNGIYVNINGKIDGLTKIIIPPEQSEDVKIKYSLMHKVLYEDDGTGNETYKYVDVGDYAQWSLSNGNDKIRWDNTNKCIIIDKNIDKGTYSVVLTADYRETFFEKNITITVSDDIPAIISADATDSGISVKLNLPDESGEKKLYVAAYDSNNKLIAVKSKKVSKASLNSGEVFVSIDVSKATSVKVMLFDNNITPVCEQYPLSISDNKN